MSENISVIVRFRKKKNTDKSHKTTEIKENVISLIDSDNVFIFDKVHNSESTQAHIYENVHSSVLKVLEGYNAAIFAYGPTSTGKTYTMFGAKDQPGIVPRVCETIFQNLKEDQKNLQFTVKCSFLEIYCENIKDLLDVKKPPKSQKKLKICLDSKNAVFVRGQLEKYVYSEEDIRTIISEGMSQRSVASTALNNTSSRSHAILSLILTQSREDGELMSKIHMIDLAGSENVEKSEVTGVNLMEAQMINKSLSALGNVIYALTEKGREHIPYRDSKLTYLLQDSLGGNSRTILFIMVNEHSPYSETLNSLNFGKRAKVIKNTPVINKSETKAVLLKCIGRLEHDLALLTTKFEALQSTETSCDEVVKKSKDFFAEAIKTYESKVLKLEDDVGFLNGQIRQYEEIIESQKEIVIQVFNYFMSKNP